MSSLRFAVINAALFVSATRLQIINKRQHHVQSKSDILKDTDIEPHKGTRGDDYDVKELFQYDFRERWEGLSFNEKWQMFIDEVPLTKLQGFYEPGVDAGPVCWPTLVGPEDSDKLAILTHGFLSCPGMWFRVVPPLVKAGFRVMLPVLPGHGLKYQWASDGEVVDESELAGNGNRSRRETMKDDLTELPHEAEAYRTFADALQQLATQFKKEHPDGYVVAAGHSLGGAITAKYAMEIPDVVDSVLLLNPMLGLAYSQIETIAKLAPLKRISKGASCERKRGTGSGGTCQFRLANVQAMADFAFATQCCDWGFQKVCETRVSAPYILAAGVVSPLPLVTEMQKWDSVIKWKACGMQNAWEAKKKRGQFGRIQNFQVATSKSEYLVDNTQIREFVKQVQESRRDLQNGYSSRIGSDFCYWPSDLGHSYVSNRPKMPNRHETKWWHPYVEHAIVEFLVYGINFGIVSREDEATNLCIQSSQDVAGSALTRLPAIQNFETYWIGVKDVAWSTPAWVLFEGPTIKEGKWLGKPHERRFEILRFAETILLVTRRERHDNVRDLFVLKNEPIQVHLNQFALKEESLKEKSLAKAKCCIRPTTISIRPEYPLGQEIWLAGNSRNKPSILSFCGKGFITVLCKLYGCIADLGAGNAETVSQTWLKESCEEDVAVTSKEVKL